jgi:ATPase family protein associated with various cellular activities (AAA)
MSSDFADLARDRHLLQEFCKYHVPSLKRFRSDASPSFRLRINEELTSKLRHLTSTATCIESLLDCPSRLRPANAGVMAATFAIKAMARPTKRWQSEESAAIYCRCRALPLVVRYLSDYDERLDEHIAKILKQLDIANDRLGLGEADPDKEPSQWYPPNAYHTYWFLRIHEALERGFLSELNRLESTFNLNRRREGMLLWAKAIAGRQIALHSANSSGLDSDQLAWSLAILTKFYPDIQYNLADQDFLREGFKSLFSNQTEAGTWQHGRPLFHYTLSGNAYCYVYETFTELLKAVLEREKEGEFLRSVLRPFSKNLVDLWNYAQETQLQLPSSKVESAILKDIGWSSGHRIDEDRREPEGWATASVFAYAQALRRLLGVWTRDEAITGLNRVSAFLTAEAGEKIDERGASWSQSLLPSVGEQLVTLFVNPVLMLEDVERSEPDNQPIKTSHARSAILFGPPGTSKTTLARAVAGAIGWQYVELHASHFVAGGLPEVQRTADQLFQRLMELDHTVVLFDEIDELVREREKEPDAFGRFLTTSMLPKLAELWDQRKVIYFVATNHIEYFDRAVTRAQRFDVLIFVGSSSYKRKVKRLQELFLTKHGAKIKLNVPAAEITAALTRLDCTDHEKAFEDYETEKKDPLPNDNVLAKFILLRWDQLDELAFLLNKAISDGAGEISFSAEQCKAALNEMSDGNLHLLKTCCDYLRAGTYVIPNYSKDVVWQVEGLPLDLKYEPPLSVSNNKVWLTTLQPPEEITAGGFRFVKAKLGSVRVLPVQPESGETKSQPPVNRKRPRGKRTKRSSGA